MKIQLAQIPAARLLAFPDGPALARWERENPLSLVIARLTGDKSHPGETRVIVGTYPDAMSRSCAAQTLANIRAWAAANYQRAAQAQWRLEKII